MRARWREVEQRKTESQKGTEGCKDRKKKLNEGMLTDVVGWKERELKGKFRSFGVCLNAISMLKAIRQNLPPSFLSSAG